MKINLLFITSLLLLSQNLGAFTGSEFRNNDGLLEIIRDISIRYNVHFTYDREIVEDVEVAHYTPDAYASVDEALSQVLAGTKLKYVMLETKYVIIYQDDAEGMKSLEQMVEVLEQLVNQNKEKRFVSPISLLESSTSFRKVHLQKHRMVLDVSGIVTDQAGEPLIGVNVMVEGTTRGTATDFDGRFTLEDVNEKATLIFSYVGYQSQEIDLNGRSNISITMIEDSQTLEEVVVVGYGTQKKASLTGSIATVNPTTLKTSPVGSLTQALQGAVPGAMVTTSNTPGGDATIRIRGFGTINNNNPLWVIDGVPQTGGLSEINPSNVESITVLKDAVSTGIYGARGANGVILVTTIQGTVSQPPKIEFSAEKGLAKNISKYDLLDAEEYGEMLWLEFANSGIPPSHPIYGDGEHPQIPKYLFPAGASEVDVSRYDISRNPITEVNTDRTDWYSEILNPAAMTSKYDLTVSGGGEKTRYSFNGGVLDEDGIVKLTGFKRYTLGMNVGAKVRPWIELGQSIKLSHVNNYGLQDQGENGALAIIPQLTPMMPVYDIMGNYAPLSRLTGFDPLNNPVANIERSKDRSAKILGIRGNIYANISLMKDFKFKTLFGYFTSDRRTKYPLTANPEAYNARSEHQLTETAGVSRQWNWTNTLNYSKTIFNDHHLELLAGMEAIDYTTESFSAVRTGFLLTNEDYWTLNAGSGTQTNSGSWSDWAMLSYFGRAHYSYQGKYLFDAVFRRDGSSRFGFQNRYGNFPALAAGWLISEESFMRNTTRWIPYLKLRVSWGISGNDQIGNYNSYSTYRTSNNYSNYPIDGSNSSLTTGFSFQAFGNPTARWEKTTSANLGLEAQLFRRLDVNIDVWNRNTMDMLFKKAIPAVNGMGDAPSVNIGNMLNRGLDFQLSYKSMENSSVKYSLSLNLSHYRNKLSKLSDRDNEVILGPQTRQHSYAQSEIGTSFPQFYGYVVEGIFQSEEEVEAHPPAFGSYNAVGRFKYKDVNGDGVIDDNDRIYIGNPHPNFTGGLISSLAYKNFDLRITLYTSVGNDIANIMRRYIDFNMFSRNRSTRRLYESWGSPYLSDNGLAKMPVAELNDANSQLPSTYFIENGSFLRLQKLQLGYSLPSNLCQRVSFENIKIFITATNLFTLTKYSGLDPQINTSDSSFGHDLGIWPTPQRFLIGINASL